MTFFIKRYILIIAVLIPLICSGQDYGKMSRFVRNLAMQNTELRAKCFTRNTPETIVALVKGTEESIAPYCITHEGDIHIANIPVTELASLSMLDGIERIEAHECRDNTCMEKSAKIVNAYSSWQGIDLPQAFRGKGTLVAINDIGFDFTHPAFLRESDGKRRITRFWDTLNMNGDAKYKAKTNFPLGRFYNNAEEIYNLGHSLDGKEIFHGTHVMGIAAGSPAGTPYSGIAPDAELYVVNNILSNNQHLLPKNYKNTYTEELRLLAWRNIFNYADSIGKPAVINYSAGSLMDITDSYKLLNDYVSRITGPGHIIVASAGNNGEDNSYLILEKGYGGGRLMTDGDYIYINISNPVESKFTIYSKSDGNKIFSKTYNLNFSRDEKKDAVNEDGLIFYKNFYDTLSVDMDSLTLIIYSALEKYDKKNTENNAYEILIKKGKKNFKDASYYIGFEYPTKVDNVVFVENGSCNPATDFDPAFTGAINLGNILSPGCLESVITVGATAHSPSFTNQYGEVHVKDYGTDGRRASFSACGPGTHGVSKPDVMAPGVNIVSALNSFYAENDTTDKDLDQKIITWTEHNGKRYPYIAQRGTSMSTPIVTGAIALWLEADPTLTTDRIKNVLEATAKKHDLTSTDYPQWRYGHGEIDIYKGLLYILGLTDVPGISTSHAKNMKATSTSDKNILVHFDNETVKTTSYSLYTRGGQLLGKGTIPAKTTTYTIPVQAKDIIVIQVDGYGSSIVANS